MSTITINTTTPNTNRDEVREPGLLSVIGQAFILPAAICATGVVLFWSLPAHAQSFSCAEAEKPAEFAICNNEDLLTMDEKLGNAFTRIYVRASTSPERQDMARSHAEWLKKRNACGADFTCLNLRYEERIRTLNSRDL